MPHLSSIQVNGAASPPPRAGPKLPSRHTVVSTRTTSCFFPAAADGARCSSSKDRLVGGLSSAALTSERVLGSCRPRGCCSLQRDTRRTATFATMPQCSNCRCYEHVECTTLSTERRSDSHSCLLTCAKGYFWQLLRPLWCP